MSGRKRKVENSQENSVKMAPIFHEFFSVLANFGIGHLSHKKSSISVLAISKQSPIHAQISSMPIYEKTVTKE
jgi:hypothetical protein